MRKINRGEEYWVKCECGTEGLHIEKDVSDYVVYFSLWYFSRFNLSWKNKLHWIWHILKGRPYHDTIIIRSSRLHEIISILEKMKEDS